MLDTDQIWWFCGNKQWQIERVGIRSTCCDSAERENPIHSGMKDKWSQDLGMVLDCNSRRKRARKMQRDITIEGMEVWKYGGGNSDSRRQMCRAEMRDKENQSNGQLGGMPHVTR
jgi:hypothetical protein